MWLGRVSEVEVIGHWGEARAERSEKFFLTPLGSSTANSTLTPELREAEVFIMDNKRCNRIYRKKSLIPPLVPLVLGNMICATNYGENLCSVSFWAVLAALLLAVTPRVGAGEVPGEGFAGLSPLCQHHRAMLCSHPL